MACFARKLRYQQQTATPVQLQLRIPSWFRVLIRAEPCYEFNTASSYVKDPLQVPHPRCGHLRSQNWICLYLFWCNSELLSSEFQVLLVSNHPTVGDVGCTWKENIDCEGYLVYTHRRRNRSGCVSCTWVHIAHRSCPSFSDDFEVVMTSFIENLKGLLLVQEDFLQWICNFLENDCHDGLYPIKMQSTCSENNIPTAILSTTNPSSFWDWHKKIRIYIFRSLPRSVLQPRRYR